jgi:hypothetical protein
VAPDVQWKSAVSLETPLYAATGSSFDSSYEKEHFSMRIAGSLKLEFGRETAVAELQLGGTTVRKTVSRMAF